MTNRHLRAAHKLAEFGWPVFPLAPFEKVPLYGSDGFREATTDSKQIEKWWSRNPDRNIGIPTGVQTFDVLDVDVKGDQSGYPALNSLRKAGLVPQHMAAVETPSRGLHLYFTGSKQNSGRVPKAHIDFRSNGGYVVVPPSAVGGRPYAVAQKAPVQAAEAIDWQKVRNHLDPPEKRPQRPAQARCDVSVERLARWVSQRQPGDRNGSLYWASLQAARAGQLDETARERFVDAALAAGLRGGEREARATVASAERGAARHPSAPLTEPKPEAPKEPVPKQEPAREPQSASDRPQKPVPFHQTPEREREGAE